MMSCETYEIELSSLLDGEAPPARAAEAVEHALGCAGCAAFFRAARRLDASARQIAADAADPRAETLWQAIRRRAEVGAESGVHTVRATPLQRSLRAAALVALGLGGGYWLSTVGGTPGASARDGGGAVVAAYAHRDRAMDERRFVALADELLGAELRYQRAMLEVLKLVPALESEEIGYDDESRPIVRAVSREDGPRAGRL